MGSTASVIVPVKDGARYLDELLQAVNEQEIDAALEILVIDSGSRDVSVEIARRWGARVIEIAPESFAHGRTRNFAAERADGDCLVFLTQDAVPAGKDWLRELLAPLDRGARIGLAFGPHLPWPGTSPVVARELEEFFGSFSPDGLPRVHATAAVGDPASGFFSNVNSAVLRTCWDEVRFRDVPYAEDQAFARDAMAAGWRKAYAPKAAVFHAHDYPFMRFMRRYFDEYRGLRETTNHVEPIGPRYLVLTVRGQVARDLSYMRANGFDRRAKLEWGLRSTLHHAGRAVFAGLGSRADRIPARARSAFSLEGRSDSTAATPSPSNASTPSGRRMSPSRASMFDYIRSSGDGQVPLALASPHDGDQPLLHLAWLIPPFRRGSGGHMTIFTIARELEAKGHSNSIWIHDPGGLMSDRAALARREIVDGFLPLRCGVFRGLEDWQGADVAFATGWQTAYPLRQLAGCKLKAYLVQDYEPDFYPASAERLWAEQTYSLGYPCIGASTWLRDLLRDRYGADAEAFELGVDFSIYRNLARTRSERTIVFYARAATPRRATELGMLALAQVVERRPDVRVVVFGDVNAPQATFEYEFAGVVDPLSLARLYNEAAVGLVISLTNYSRMPKEMMACGLPVVDVRHPSVVSAFDPGVIELAEPDIGSIADSLTGLLDDGERRHKLGENGREFVSGMTWAAAAGQLEQHVRRWLRERWHEAAESAGQPDSGLASVRARLT